MNLKKLVNDKPLWDSFLEYIDKSITEQHKAMEQATDIQVVFRTQGAITALRRLKYLRDEMNGTD
tara:strand:- start:3718 stop:3912 length:195 start_codon:yes stop_codon:yes gene_type:complete